MATSGPTTNILLDAAPPDVICDAVSPPPLIQHEPVKEGPDTSQEWKTEDESNKDTPIANYLVRSLSRSALCMLWHQQLAGTSQLPSSVYHAAPFRKRDARVRSSKNARSASPQSSESKPSGNATILMRSTICYQGISIDFGFMVQKSSDKKWHHNLVGLNGETFYALITDHFSGRLNGRAFASKAPPIEWNNSWLANNSPSCTNKYVRKDGGGELGKSRDVHQTFSNFGYTVDELTGPNSSNQNGPGEWPDQTILGDGLHAMQSGANLRPNFWPYTFHHYLRLYNFVPHSTRMSSPYEMCGSELPNLSKLRTFGCRVHIQPTSARYGTLVSNSRLGIFLGYSRSLKII